MNPYRSVYSLQSSTLRYNMRYKWIKCTETRSWLRNGLAAIYKWSVVHFLYTQMVDINWLNGQLTQTTRTTSKHQRLGLYRKLKLPSLLAAWLFWTFHTISHNMKALVILSHSWSPFLPPTCLYGKMNFYGSLCSLLGHFLEKKLLPDYPCKSHDHDHR